MRNFSYVKDVACGVSLAALTDKTKGEVLHIAGDKDYSIRELAELIGKLIPNTKIINTDARKVDTTRGILDITKAKNMLGYSPEYNLEAGIREYIKWVVEVYSPLMNLKIVNNPVI